MNKSIEIPGVVWTILLVGLPMLAAYLEQYFGTLVWAAPVAGLILIVAKIAQVYRDGGVDPSLPAGVAFAAPDLPKSKSRKLLWG